MKNGRTGVRNTARFTEGQPPRNKTVHISELKVAPCFCKNIAETASWPASGRRKNCLEADCKSVIPSKSRNWETCAHSWSSCKEWGQKKIPEERVCVCVCVCKEWNIHFQNGNRNREWKLVWRMSYCRSKILMILFLFIGRFFPLRTTLNIKEILFFP